MENIKQFLIEAKKNTYANSKVLKTQSSRLGSEDYHYDGFVNGKKASYHDTYFGGERFIGEEIVYLEDKPVWGMNYYGYALVAQFYEDAIKKVLRPALLNVERSSLPLRGPNRFQTKDYIYTFESSGTLENFSGIEKIFKNNQLIYELRCSGGKIKRRTMF